MRRDGLKMLRIEVRRNAPEPGHRITVIDLTPPVPKRIFFNTFRDHTGAMAAARCLASVLTHLGHVVKPGPFDACVDWKVTLDGGWTVTCTTEHDSSSSYITAYRDGELVKAFRCPAYKHGTARAHVDDLIRQLRKNDRRCSREGD